MAFELAAQNIVVVGEFNRAIIRPKWLVKQEILPDGEIQAKLTDRPGAPTSFQFAMFDWEVGPSRLTLKPLPPEMPDPGSVMARILEVLQHTPISALGHNFLFNAPLDDAAQMPRLGNSSAADVARFLHIEEPTSSGWSMLVGSKEGYRLGVTIRAEPTNQKADINFHFECADASQAVAAARRVNEMRDRAREIVDQIAGAK